MLARGQVGSLDDLLVTYCPEFSMMTEYNITLKQLASQVSQTSPSKFLELATYQYKPLDTIHPLPLLRIFFASYTAFWFAKGSPLWSTRSAQYMSSNHIPSSPRTEN
jgi:hypothetical protein